MESKWKKLRREYDAHIKTDGELPKTDVIEPPVTKPNEKPSKREVRNDAE